MAKFIKFKQKWGYFMLFVNKLKVLTLMTCLVLVGQGFAQESSQSSAPESSSSSKMDFWSDYTSEPATQVINGKTYYSITTAEELAWFAALTNTNEKNNANKYTGKNAILLADIDLSGKLWVPIAAGKGDGIFQGTFDGNHHTITGLTIDGLRIAYETENIYCKEHENKPLCNGQNIGFFGSSKGIIKNLTLEVADIQASNSEGLTMQMGKPISVGTLIGWQNGGTVDGIYVSGHINTSGSGQGVGGIVGNAAQGTISNSVSDVSIYASGDNVFIGGVVGYTKGSVNVNSCVYSGEHIVNDGHNGAVGGIVGNSTSANLNATNSYYDTDMFGDKGVGTGKVNADKKPAGVDEINSEQVACGMNGGTWDANTAACTGDTTDVWSTGISELSLNGSDGFKVVFVVNGENAEFPQNAVTSKVVAKNASITADGISLPSREGFKFAGWAETSNAAEPSANLGTATGRRTIYAVWYEKFLVTFDAGTGSFPNGTPDPLNVAKGDLISLDIDIPEKSADGVQKYSFAGWSTSSQEIIFEADADIVGLWNFDEDRVSGPTVLYAAWTKAEVYTVKFNANGHGKTEWDQVNVSKDEHLATPPLTADPGYQYDGWYTEPTFDNKFVAETTLITKNYELFAKWSAISYPITYDLNDGTAPDPANPSTYTIEDQFELKDPSRVCYDFIEWYDLEGNHVEGITKGTLGEKAFSARWKQQTKVINYSTGNIIQATASSQEFLCGETVTLSDTVLSFSRPGYKQDGWSLTPGANVTYGPGATFTGVQNVTLYAHWSLNTYSINYEGVDGATNPNPPSYTVESEEITLSDPEKTGYTFDGWFVDEDLTESADIVIPQGSTGDKTFYAKWVPVPYTITYNIDGEPAELTPNTYTAASATELATPTRNGYEFDGWYSNDEYTGDKATSIAAGSIGDTAFFAKWTPVEYSITYVLEEGASNDNDNPASYTVETDAFTLKDAVKNGYTFEGWFNGEGEKVTTVAGGATGNLELTAQFTIETYTITYHNIEGATFETENPTSYTVETLPIVLKNPTKEGYNFEGWFTDESFTENPITGIETRLSNGNGDLYAKWSDPIEYTISYVIDDEAAALTPNGFTVVDNVTLAVPEMDDGYVFDGWYLDEEMTGEKVTSFEAGTYAANQTFYGKTIRSYTITYVGADGLENLNPTSYTVLENDLGLLPVAKPGFKFLGWFDENGLVESIPQNSAEDITLTAHWAAFPVVTQYGGVTITEYEDHTKLAEIDENYFDAPIEITENISVNTVVFNRVFKENIPSTIMLPFSIPMSQVEGGKFYGVTLNYADGSWSAKAEPELSGVVQANTPYLYRPTATTISFNNTDPVVFNTTGSYVSEPHAEWEFKGVYSYKKFEADDPELGRAYGFAGKTVNGYAAGDFVMAGVGAWLNPMRCYLVHKAPTTTKSANVSRNATLPETIKIEFYDENAKLIDVGTWDLKSGNISMDRWYDLHGRLLNGKPTTQGTYYHNGKRVIVK